MTTKREPPVSRVAGFRTKLLVAMMLVVGSITILALYLAERGLAARVELNLQREFEAELATLRHTQEIRQAALVERCRALVRRARIHAALEDDALDLLYPNAKDELRDVMATAGAEAAGTTGYALRARFYRFLQRDGSVIPPLDSPAVGRLQPEEEAKLALPSAPDRQQLGYILRRDGGGEPQVCEVIAMPIVSIESGEVIAALVLGFPPHEFGQGAGVGSAIWLDGRLHSRSLPPAAAAALAHVPTRASTVPQPVELDGTPQLLFSRQLNPDSVYPPAYEVCVFPLTELHARQRQLRWQILGAGGLLLLVGLGASQVAALRLSAPVEKLAVDSEEDRAQRARAEAALDLTSAELQRSARFSADASHQLKTPVSVLRAGLDELLARENLTPEECREISALIHQTYRLSSLIEDLLLLSRMDAGRLKLDFAPVNLTQLIEASLDDLGATPDDRMVTIETDFPPGLHIAGEKRYTAIILQNLLENARKYNQPGGRIRLAARVEGEVALLSVRNTGRPIAPASQAHIFERFHRGAMGEDVPGYGLGLNLARELARLHHGELRLVRSDDAGTEFEVRFRVASAPVDPSSD